MHDYPGATLVRAEREMLATAVSAANDCFFCMDCHRGLRDGAARADRPEGELPAGRLVRVNKDGSQTTLASEGLAAPGGFVLGHGAAYITNNSILSDAGQVVKVAI